MPALSASDRIRIAEKHGDLLRAPILKRFGVVIGAAACVLYTLYCWWFFSIGSVLQRADWSIAGAYLADWVSYESRPDIRFRGNHLDVKFPRFDPFGEFPEVDWLTAEKSLITPDALEEKSGGGAASSAGSFMAPGAPSGSSAGARSSADSFMAPSAPSSSNAGAMAGAEIVESTPRELVTKVNAAIGDASFVIVPGRVELVRGATRIVFSVDETNGVITDRPLPDWIEQKAPGAIARVYLGIPGRVEIDDDEVSVRHRFLGWENFIFDTDSPFWGKSVGEVAGLVFGGERLDPKRSNLALAWSNILNNAEWQHGDVWLKLLQTIVMAFVGTLLASLVAFPLSLLAARNITSNRPLNWLMKRFFDFQRSVDMLIWALFFTRAFGPGPLAGMSAIFFTDTGTLGKLFSESLENIDDKQREGVRAVGASPALVQRFGVTPQVLPVFLSQTLYFWESNTRSATIIGAVGAGGIGLKLWEAMRTNQDWENVFYMVILILIVVFVFDAISNSLRQRLIRPQGSA
ncbi:MAG: phosphonate ABC transporter, permease protein PhnE [Phyllobacteriaceae bacterium]|nr:phosphonate ABC transporter, permease protein PhnE [Phyllobacteriaceae bacterium]